MNERLEEIEEWYEYNHGKSDWKVVSIRRKDFEWLIEQAKQAEYLEIRSENTVGLFNKQRMQEKIEELEEQSETNGSAFHTLENLFIESEQQNKRYREALEFYANQSNWMNIEVPTMMDGEPEMVTREPLIFDDGGRKAREALEEPE